MGVAANGPYLLSDIAPRAPLLKFLEITPEHNLSGKQNEEILPYSERLYLS